MTSCESIAIQLFNGNPLRFGVHVPDMFYVDPEGVDQELGRLLAGSVCVVEKKPFKVVKVIQFEAVE